MEQRPVIWLVGSECNPGREAEYNEFYNKEHMPTALKGPGMIRGTRYQRVGHQFEYPKYLAIYEMDSEAATEAFLQSETAKEVAKQQFQGRGKDLGMKLRWLVRYKPVGP